MYLQIRKTAIHIQRERSIRFDVWTENKGLDLLMHFFNVGIVVSRTSNCEENTAGEMNHGEVK